MLVVMQSHATPEQIEQVVEAIRQMNLTPHSMPGATRTAIGITGNVGAVDSRTLEVLPGVMELIRVTKPYKLASREMHPADTADRREIAQDDFGLGYCNITKCCTEVCPEHIKITDNALIPMKERVAGRKYDPLVWLGAKIGRRTAKDTPKVPGKA